MILKQKCNFEDLEELTGLVLKTKKVRNVQSMVKKYRPA